MEYGKIVTVTISGSTTYGNADPNFDPDNFITLDGSSPVGLDRQVTLYISSDDSKINGAAFDGENQILI